jgi:hypothetical protein
MSPPRQSAAVTRDYRPDPGNCARALELLLKKSARKKAAESTPKPDDRDDAKESHGCIATEKHTR